MASTVVDVTTTVASTVSTTTTVEPLQIITNNNSVIFNYPWTTEATIYDWDYYYYPVWVYWAVFVFVFIIVFPLIVTLSARRRRQMTERAIILQRQQARRQMEITISNNNNVNGPPGVGNGVVMSNEHTVSKNLDLPPTYDEVALNSDSKQFNPALCNDGSTLTIATNLECSNPNLTEGYGEPPAYVPPSTMSTTVVVNNSNMPIV